MVADGYFIAQTQYCICILYLFALSRVRSTVATLYLLIFMQMVFMISSFLCINMFAANFCTLSTQVRHTAYMCDFPS